MTRNRLLVIIAAASVAVAFFTVRRLDAGDEVFAEVRFDRKLRDWDGFGVNYVEVAQTRDYKKDPQEYGGFSTLSRQKREEILELIFGPDGLKPALLKMFLDPFHEGMREVDNDNEDPNIIDMSRFDHQTTTRWMLYFAKEGLNRTRARGGDLQIITTLYGPPAWTTKQKFVRGRDLDPAMKEEVAEYIISWVKWLRQEHGLPVNYISLHNEGEDFGRWPTDGSWGGYPRHDYNMYWHNTQVVDFLRLMRPMLDRQGLTTVGLAPGETSRWDRFINWGYAWGIYNDPEALRNIALITSHGFGSNEANTSMGVDLLRLKRPDLHAWTTSMTWGRMDVNFLELIRQQIYHVKVNGVIPWACVQTDTWIGGDPNPGTAFRVDRNGGYTIEPGYYFFQQVSRAGQPGMAVAEVLSHHPDIKLIAFAGNGTSHPDAFAIFNLGRRTTDMIIEVGGSASTSFEAYVTGPKDRYRRDGTYKLRNGALEVTIYPGMVATFFGK